MLITSSVVGFVLFSVVSLTFTYSFFTYPVLLPWFTLYQSPDSSIISSSVFIFNNSTILELVEASFLKFKVSVFTVAVSAYVLTENIIISVINIAIIYSNLCFIYNTPFDIFGISI